MYVCNFSSIFFLFFVGQSGTKFVCLFILFVYRFVFICRSEVLLRGFMELYFCLFSANDSIRVERHVTGDLYYYGLCFYTQF